MRKATELSKRHPLDARCFSTVLNRVKKRQPRAFIKPDQKKINKMLNSELDFMDGLDAESYAVIRINSQNRIINAIGIKAQDQALEDYVNTRKNLLTAMYQNYGYIGYLWMRGSYESSQDDKIVKWLKDRYLQDKSVNKDNPLIKNIALLVDNPKDFIPCYMRISSEPSMPANAMQVKYQPPEPQALKTSLRGTN